MKNKKTEEESKGYGFIGGYDMRALNLSII